MLYVWIVIGLTLLFSVSLFNLLVRDKNRVKEGWAGIDVQLKRRKDLLPKLIKTVEAYMSYEKSALIDITSARAGKEIQQIIARAEAYPNLKADQTYLTLAKEITNVEEELQMARRYYNGCVRDFNVRIESFPSLILARAFNFTKIDFFQVDEADRKDVSL